MSNLQTSVFNGWQKNGRSSDTKRTLADVTRIDKIEIDDQPNGQVNPIAALHHQHHPGV